MNQLAIDRRGLGAFGLVISAGLAVTGSLLPVFEMADTTGGAVYRMTITAWQSYLEPNSPGQVGSWAPRFGFPLALAAAVEVVAALLLVRSRATAVYGRLAAIAGSAILLGAAWSTLLFVSMLGTSVAQGVTSRSIGTGMWLIGAAWVLGTVSAVVVQDVLSAEEPEYFDEELDPEPGEEDAAVIYRIDGNDAADDVDTPPLGLPELTEAERFVVLVDDDRGKAPS